MFVANRSHASAHSSDVLRQEPFTAESAENAELLRFVSAASANSAVKGSWRPRTALLVAECFDRIQSRRLDGGEEAEENADAG